MKVTARQRRRPPVRGLSPRQLGEVDARVGAFLRALVSGLIADGTRNPSIQALARGLGLGILADAAKPAAAATRPAGTLVAGRGILEVLFVCPSCRSTNFSREDDRGTPIARCGACDAVAPSPYWSHFRLARPFRDAAEAKAHGIS